MEFVGDFSEEENSWDVCETPLLIRCNDTALGIQWVYSDKLCLWNDDVLLENEKYFLFDEAARSHYFDPDVVVGRKIQGL